MALQWLCLKLFALTENIVPKKFNTKLLFNELVYEVVIFVFLYTLILFNSISN